MRELIPLAIVGMLIVFAVLAVIVLFVRAVQWLDSNWQARERARRERELARAPSLDNTTLVLIAAAVATLVQGRSRILHVRRLLPIGSQQSPWALRGRLALQESHAPLRRTGR